MSTASPESVRHEAEMTVFSLKEISPDDSPTGCCLLVLSVDILQGWESIKALILAKAPAAAKPLVQYIVRCKIRPNMAAALRYQVSLVLWGLLPRPCSIAG